MTEPRRHIHLEHDGKLPLVDLQGKGPAIPQMGRKEMADSRFASQLLKKQKDGFDLNTKRTNDLD